MVKKELDILSEYYQYELSYLRSAGAEFASNFPKIARRLDLSSNESADPHVEHLIESVAFLTGKLQKQIDDQFPEIARNLLSILYSPLMLPTPSCVFVHFEVDLTRAILAPGFVIPRSSLLQATSHSGEICSFMTSHDVELWPITIENVSVVSKEELPSYYATSTYYIMINFKYSGPRDGPFPKKLRFYIHANALLKGKIFSAIFSTEAKVLYEKDGNFEFLDVISPVGLEDEEALLPYPDTVHKGFRVLQEYFAFADKFYGFDIKLPEEICMTGDGAFYIPMSYDISMQILKENFSLFSVPAINLFPKTTEPLRIDHTQIEYPLIPDYRLYGNHEIYRIERMVAINEEENDEVFVPEFFSCDHSDEYENGLFWTSRRKKSTTKDALGEDVVVSFVDTKFNEAAPKDKFFFAYTLCTNRGVAQYIPPKGKLDINFSAPVLNVYCVDHPTAERASLENGAVLWKLISLLSLNSLSFSSEGIKKIKNVLNIFADVFNSGLAGEVDAIVDVQSKISTRRIHEQTWLGFIRGTQIEITFDDSVFNLGLPLSMVIAKFLTSYASINTFVDVSVKNLSKNGVLKKWKHRFGLKEYL